MKTTILFIILFLTLSMVACSRSDNDNSHTSGYQIIASTDGRVYRLDTKTGDVMVIEQGNMHRVGTGYETNTGKYKVKMDTMPEPSEANKGQTITDTTTGMRYRSDGVSWLLIKVEPRKTGETVSEYLKRTKDPLGIR